MSSDFIHDVLRLMREDGLLVDNPIADGQLHRCAVEGKERARDGAYIIHADKNPSAWWKNWKSGVENTHCEKVQEKMTPKQRKAYAAFVREAREKAIKQREKAWQAGAKAVLALWNSAKPANDSHPYLKAKNVPAIGLRLDGRNNLLVPVMDADGAIQSLQKIPESRIAGKWGKFFVSGGKTGGGFYPILATDGAKDGPLLLAEGYATGASCHMATGHACLAAFNAGNLEQVARLARQLYPTRKICLCADYDEPNKTYPEKGGTGVAMAKKAALAIGAYLAVCPSIDGAKADFNDIAEHDGLFRVQDVINKALAGEPANSCPMPKGYSLIKTGRNAGLYYLKENKDGGIEQIKLGPPLEVMADTRDADGNDWGLFLKWHDNDGMEHTWAMPKTLLYMQNGDWLARLAYGGWHGNPACKKYIAAFLADVRPVRRIRCVDKTGWEGDCYVLPDVVYGQNRNEDIVLQSLYHNGLYESAGTFEGWQEVARLCAGNSRLGFALSCAFAGPLLKLAGLEGGCFAFEGGSSCGKTTALKIAASVWGGEAHVRGWRTTDNGLEGLAALHNDNLLILDELSQVGARVLDEAIYMLANGSGKTRAGKDGNLRKPQRWLALVLSSGELGLADKLAEDGRRARAGQDVRFCGISVEKSHIGALHAHKDAGSLVRRVNELCGLHYGHAGRKFLQKMSQPEILANAREKLRSGIEEQARAICPEKADSQVMRVAMRFMLVSMAGTIAQQLGILPENFKARDYAKACFEAWLEKRGGAGAAEDAAILAQVKLFIEQHGQSRFQDWNNPEATCINRVGFRKEDTFYCLPEAFKAEVIKGYGLKRAIEVLTRAGWLKRYDGRHVQTVIRMPRGGTKRVYVLQIAEENEEI